MIKSKQYEQELREREIRQKQFDAIVKPTLERVMASVINRQPVVSKYHFYGATGIDPKLLTVWYLFLTDADQTIAKQNGLQLDLDRLTREELFSSGYSPKDIKDIMVDFTSEEDIERQTKGNYYLYFK
jgi:hypothetical protein